MTIKEFKQKHNQGPETKVRRIGNNRLEVTFTDGTVSIVLHNTAVVTKKPNGTIQLDSNSWQTVTTKKTINDHLPAHFGIMQKDYQWYLVQTNESHGAELQRVKFEDNMMIFPDGTILSLSDIPC